MTLNDIMISEVQTAKRVNRRAWFAAMTALLTCSFMFVMQFVCSFAVSALAPDLSGEIAPALVDMLCYILYLAVPFGIAAIIFKTCLSSDDGYKPKYMTPKKPVLYILGAVGVGYIVNITVNILFGWLLERFNTPATAVPETTAGIILLYISTALLPAILEEWAFRGVILKNLLPYGRKGAIIISAVLFGIMHVDPARVIFASVFGLLLAICYEYTRSIKIPVIIHFINNSIAVTATISEGNEIISTVIGFIIFGFMGFGIASLIYFIRNGVNHKIISLNRPLHIGYKLTSGKFLLKALLNPGMIPLALLYLFIFSAYFFF